LLSPFMRFIGGVEETVFDICVAAIVASNSIVSRPLLVKSYSAIDNPQARLECEGHCLSKTLDRGPSPGLFS
jgi:hypothetical protein